VVQEPTRHPESNRNPHPPVAASDAARAKTSRHAQIREGREVLEDAFYQRGEPVLAEGQGGELLLLGERVKRERLQEVLAQVPATWSIPPQHHRVKGARRDRRQDILGSAYSSTNLDAWANMVADSEARRLLLRVS
jgi:hypothetical protein